jgi:hypothetical protein
MTAGDFTNDSNLELCDRMVQRIATSRDRRITFAEYMEWVLYDSQQGYYATNHANIGAAGDRSNNRQRFLQI